MDRRGRVGPLIERLRAADWNVGSPHASLADLRVLLATFAIWRVVQAVVAARFADGPFGPTTYFDGQFYLSIATDGYQLTDPSFETFQNVNFWPALPMLARPFIGVFGEEWGPIVVANILAFTAFVAVWFAAQQWFDRRTADLTVVFLACWPGSMFLWGFLSEGLFVTVTAGAFWAEARGRHRVAAAFVFVAGMTRSVGVVFGPVLILIHAWRHWRIDRVAVGYALSSAASLAAVLLIMENAVGDAFAPFKSQEAWGRSLGPPWVPLVDAAEIIVEKLPSLALETSMNVVATLLFLTIGAAGLWVALRDQRGAEPRPAPAHGLWTLAAVSLPQFTGQITSMLRYVLGAWPGFVLVAVAMRDRPRLRLALLVAQGVLSLWLLRRHALGIWVS